MRRSKIEDQCGRIICMRIPGAFARRPIQSVWLMLMVALLYRLVVGIHFLRIGGMTFQWTNEMAGIAHSLVQHHEFAGAYRGSTGPTAWAAPVYPFVVAAVFRVFGVDSEASAVVLLLLNNVVSSLTAVVIYKLGREFLSEKVGLIAGWAWALSPLGVLMPLLLWDTSLSAFMLSLGLLVVLRAKSLGQWTAAGALWGVSTLVNPALLAPLPAMLIARLWKVPGRMRMGLAFCLTLICVLVPWTIRNRVQLHAFYPVRSNGWAEIYFGNVNFGLHPAVSPTGLYQQLGEPRFVELLKRGAIQYIREHPGRFALMSLERWIRFWFAPVNFLPLTLISAVGCWVGAVLLLRNIGRLAIPFVAVPMCYPIMFSMTHIETRYRHPIEPIIYLLAAYAGCELYRRYRGVEHGRLPGQGFNR
jgi:hypothetical protein